jgi:hypothetical protein
METDGETHDEVLLVLRVLVDAKVLLDEALDALRTEVEPERTRREPSADRVDASRQAPWAARGDRSRLTGGELTASVHPPASAPQ